MLFAAYILFASGVRFALHETESAQRRPALLRGSTATLALLIGGGATLWLIHLVRDPELAWGDFRLPYVLTAAITAGAVTYTLGTSFPGTAALAMRRAGWGAMTIPLLVPSTFTLALPLMAPLALTLGDVPKRQSVARAAGSPSRGPRT